MLTLLAAVALAASSQPIVVAAPTLNSTGLQADLPGQLTERWAAGLARSPHFRVVTSRQLVALLSLERQKQLLGCAEEGSTECMAELASALGSEVVLSGSVTRVEQAYVATLSLVAVKTGRTVSTFTTRTLGLDSLFAALEEAGETMGQETLVQLRPSEATTGGAARRWSWVPAAAGVGLAAAGAVFLLQAEDASAQLLGRGAYAGRTLDPAQAQLQRDRGATSQTVGAVLVTAGVAAVAAGGAMFVFGGPRPLVVTAAPTPGGAAVLVGGTFP